MLNSWIIWLLVALGLLLFEALTPGAFFFLSFAVGALAASGCAFFVSSLALNFLVGLVASGVAFLLLSKLVADQKLSVAERKNTQTNVDALPGGRVTVQAHITSEGVGFVKLEGELWSAKNLGPELQAGEIALVLKVEGNKLFIKKMG